MKKILIINTTLNSGGAARVARDLFEQIGTNFDIFFAYGRGKKVENSKAFKFGNSLEVFFHLFLVRFFGMEGLGSFFSTKKLINFIKKEKFDLIHLHNLHGYYINFFKLIEFIQSKKIPVVWTLHDEWPLTWLPAYRTDCEYCVGGYGKCSNGHLYPKNYFPIFKSFMLNKKRKVFSNNWNPVLVCPSEWLGGVVAQSYLSKFKLNIIKNGINTDLFKPCSDKSLLRNKYGLPLDKKIILFVAANLEEQRKGVNHIIKVAEFLNKKNYLFLGIGHGKISAPANVKITGYIDNKNKLAEMYALSDLFCFASSAETFLLTAAEAMSCGVPVVGFEIPIVKEIFQEKVGKLVELNNDRALAEAIDNLFSNEAEMLNMGTNGRKFITDNYSQELFYQNYNNLYNELLK